VVYGLGRGHINHHDFVLAVAAVKHGGVPAIGMDGDIHREIAGLDLPTHGSERPLVRQQNRPIRLRTGEAGFFRGAGKGEEGEDGGELHRPEA
jgi:hypothetical protein